MTKEDARMAVAHAQNTRSKRRNLKLGQAESTLNSDIVDGVGQVGQKFEVRIPSASSEKQLVVNSNNSTKNLNSS